MVRKTKNKKNKKLKKIEEYEMSLSLKCKCGDSLFIINDIYKENFITLNNAILLKCETCDKKYKSPLFDQALQDIKEKFPIGIDITYDFSKITTSLIDCYDTKSILPFKYDTNDYFYIPGLYRNHDTGFLTPVFFNKDVLLKYIYNPSYELDFKSGTYFTIKSDEFYISLGINKNDKVIMWLGDILKLPLKEQYYLISENIESDHSIDSSFYDGQINCIFGKPTSEAHLLNSKNKLIRIYRERHSVELGHLDFELLKIFESLRRPLFNNLENFLDSILKLNKIFVESINTSSIKESLDSFFINGKEKSSLKQMGSLKTLSTFLKKIELIDEDQVNSLMCPFFVLNDLRQLSGHLLSKEREQEILESCLERIGISSEIINKKNGYFIIYDTLLEKMITSYEFLENHSKK